MVLNFFIYFPLPTFFWAPNFFENAWSISHDPFSILVSFSRQWKQDLTWPDLKILTQGRTGLSKVGRGQDFNICLKTRMGVHTPPRPKFGTRMENNYIFWNKNGIGVPCPKHVPLPFLTKIHNIIKPFYYVFFWKKKINFRSWEQSAMQGTKN